MLDVRAGAREMRGFIVMGMWGRFTVRRTRRTRRARGAGMVAGAVAGVAALLAAALPATAAPGAVARAEQPVVGSDSVLAMLVYWTAPDEVPPSGAASLVSRGVDTWFAENSYGAFRTTGTATPWMQITHSDCTDDLPGILADAEAQARTQGYDPSSYDTEVVYFPYADCGGWSVRTAGRRVVFVNGDLTVHSVVHGMGHLKGLRDAGALVCRDRAGDPVPLSRDCSRTRRGDYFDAMGDDAIAPGDAGHYNAAEKSALGWLDGRVRTVHRRAHVTLAPYETRSARLKAVRVPTRGATYWLEYRQPIGADGWLLLAPGITDGVLVHVKRRGHPGTDLLDMRPATTLPDGRPDPRDAALAAGHRWRTPEGAVIRVRSATPHGVRVVVRVPASARR